MLSAAVQCLPQELLDRREAPSAPVGKREKKNDVMYKYKDHLCQPGRKLSSQESIQPPTFHAADTQVAEVRGQFLKNEALDTQNI